jgi:hypothetical protein
LSGVDTGDEEIRNHLFGTTLFLPHKARRVECSLGLYRFHGLPRGTSSPVLRSGKSDKQICTEQESPHCNPPYCCIWRNWYRSAGVPLVVPVPSQKIPQLRCRQQEKPGESAGMAGSETSRNSFRWPGDRT